jgi:hypothetical protein
MPLYINRNAHFNKTKKKVFIREEKKKKYMSFNFKNIYEMKYIETNKL